MKARTVIPILAMPAAPAPSTGRLATVGRWLRDHATLLRRLQWAVVLVYAALLVIPALLPLPDDSARMLNNLTIFAQFVFWESGGRLCCCRWCCLAASGAACCARKAR